MSWIVFISKLLSPDFKTAAKASNKIQVITIGFSHFCELAIWSLKARNLPYEEYVCTPIQHIFPSLTVRVGDKAQKYLSESSRTSEVAPPNLNDEELAAFNERLRSKDRQARATAVPLAVCPDGQIWKDSWEVATKTGLVDIDPELKAILDEKVGPLSRQLAYSYILKPSNNNIWNELLTCGTSWVWKLLWWLYLGSYLRKLMSKTMKTDKPLAVANCKAKLDEAIHEIDLIIEKRSTQFLGGNSLGVADIAVASLTAPLVNPDMYCGGRYGAVFAKLMQQDKELLGEVEKFRATTTGKYCLELYAKYR